MKRIVQSVLVCILVTVFQFCRPCRALTDDPERALGKNSLKAAAGEREGTFTWSNPIYFQGRTGKDEVRDPCIIKEGDTYYLVFTVWPFRGRDENHLSDPDQGSSPGIKLYSSNDLVNWTFENWLVKSSLLPEDCPYKHRFWAPEIHKIAGRFYLIFTADNWIRKEYNPAGSWGSAGYAFVGVAEKIAGPYKHITYIRGGACDTSLFEDVDGKTYAIIPAYDVFVQQIDLSRIVEGEVRLFGPRQKAVNAKNDDIGLAAEPDYLEGPWMIKHGSRYYLFSAGPYRREKNPPERLGYWAGVAYADGPLGPWTKDPRGQLFWGGHLAVFEGPDGRHWFSYRGEKIRGTRGFLCIDPFDMGPDGRVRPHGPSIGEVSVPAALKP